MLRPTSSDLHYRSLRFGLNCLIDSNGTIELFFGTAIC